MPSRPVNSPPFAPWHLLRSLALALLVALVAFCPGRAQAFIYGGKFASAEEEHAVLEAEQALALRDYDRALELSRKATKDFPDSLEAIRTLVGAAQATHWLRDLVKEYSPEAAPADRKVQAWYAQGWAATMMGDYRSALRSFEQAMAATKQPSFELRRAWLVARRFDPRVDEKLLAADYEKFLADYRDVGLAWVSYVNYQAMMAPQSRAHGRAVADALAQPAKHPKIFLLATEYEEYRDFWYDPATGLELVEKGLALFPDNVELGQKHTRILRQLGRTEEALAEAREWRKRGPNSGEFIIDEAAILADLGRYEEAAAATADLRKVRYQQGYIDRVPLDQARYLRYAGRENEAVEILARALAEEPTQDYADEIQRFLTQLQSKAPGARVNVLRGVGYLQQAGNYCGPASVCMVLGYWGQQRSQHDIASFVYTGVAGTPPQVLHHYAELVGLRSVEFKSDPETWKKLIDAGYPILWLQMLARRGGHYRVVVGYDDVTRSWIVHDPNFFTATEIPYDSVDDQWLLPAVGRSMVLFPPEKANDRVLAGLGPTPMLLATNWAFYVATGSNLFVSLWPALPVNMAVAFVLALLMAGLLRRVSFPRPAMTWKRLILPTVVLAAIINLIIGFLRLNEAVSVLLSLHLALVTAIPLLVLIRVGRRAVGDYLHPRESIGMCLLVLATWLSLAFIDRDPWQWIVPVGIFVVGGPLIIWPRLRLKRAEALAARGDLAGALVLARRYGREGPRYFAALCLEMEVLIRSGQFAPAEDRAREVGEEVDRPKEKAAFRLVELLARTLRAPDAETAQLLKELAASPDSNGRMRLLAEALAIYAEGVGVAPTTAHDPEATVRSLAHLADRTIAGFAPGRILAGRPMPELVLRLAVLGAMGIHRRKGNEPAAAEIFDRWGGRFGLGPFLAERLRGVSGENESGISQ